ncbi:MULTISPECIES: hypothetical protein [Curtobacterium]|uniref:hypothetical protein n=1 Tax=Curtobacterium flaccumfaciens TaxID=2035 RepID=UPI003EE4B5EF
MDFLTARTWLVIGAVGLVALGVLAPVAGAARVAAIAAGLVLALLDRVLVQQAVRATTVPFPVGVPDADVPPTGGPDTASPTQQVSADDPAGTVVVGHAPDEARTVRTDAQHLVVVGRGVLARAVFDALVAQCRAEAADVRDSDALPCDLVPLPEGSAVVSCVHGRTGASRTVVLVPEHGQVPRRTDLLVTVGPSGCTAREDGGPAVRIAPILPLVEVPAALGAEQGPKARGPAGRTAGRRLAVRLSAGRLRRGRHPPARPRRAPARPSPP